MKQLLKLALIASVFATPVLAQPAPSTSGAAVKSEQVTANTTLGSPSASACATDNGTCAIAALIKRLNQRLTTINTTLGSPFQAGGSIGNTTFAATQSGTWNIGNVSGTISLPTGASTAANQTTLNGYVDGLEGYVDQLEGYTDGIEGLLTTINASLDDIEAAAEDTTIVAFKTDQTTHGTTDLVAADITKVAGAAVATGNGTASGAIRVALPTDGTGVVILGAGTAGIGKLTANSGVDIGDVDVTSLPSFSATATSSGLSRYTLEPGASDNHADIKTSAGQVYGIQAFTTHTAAQFIRLYNVGSSFNACNSATGLMWEGIIPAASTGAGLSVNFPTPLPFSTAINICVTGGYGQTDTTSATASKSVVNVQYK